MKDIIYLKNIDQIRTLMARYVRFADMKQWSHFADLFTLDGRITQLGGDGKQIVQIKGREEIGWRPALIVGNSSPLHHLFSYEIDIRSDEEASGVFAMEDYIIPAGGAMELRRDFNDRSAVTTANGNGYYCADFKKIEGKWLIEDLILTRLPIGENMKTNPQRTDQGAT